MTLFGKGPRSPLGWQVAKLSVMLWVVLTLPAPAQTAKPRETLYQRLGGYVGIASYIAVVFPRVAQRPELTHLFRGHTKDSQQKQFQPTSHNDHLRARICR